MVTISTPSDFVMFWSHILYIWYVKKPVFTVAPAIPSKHPQIFLPRHWRKKLGLQNARLRAHHTGAILSGFIFICLKMGRKKWPLKKKNWSLLDYKNMFCINPISINRAYYNVCFFVKPSGLCVLFLFSIYSTMARSTGSTALVSIHFCPNSHLWVFENWINDFGAEKISKKRRDFDIMPSNWKSQSEMFTLLRTCKHFEICLRFREFDNLGHVNSMGFGQWAWCEARPSLSTFTSTVRLINRHLNLTKNIPLLPSPKLVTDIPLWVQMHPNPTFHPTPTR